MFYQQKKTYRGDYKLEKEIDLQVGKRYLIKEINDTECREARIVAISPNREWVSYVNPNIVIDYNTYCKPYIRRERFLEMVVDTF
jgi:hypothetical protein